MNTKDTIVFLVKAFFTQSQLINDCSCPDCGKQTRILKEESYFFKLSKYQDKILQWYEEKDPILPKNKKKRTYKFCPKRP
ncbi:class I tRNA ligase family protein [Campylobacter jejuni]|nr:class I tRNA ligase family protein [Campylobacter jejuni]